MYNLGRDFQMVYHNNRYTEDRRFFLGQYEEKPENMIPMVEDYRTEIKDVSDKVIVSIECGECDKDSKLPIIRHILVPMGKDKLVKHHELGDCMLWFNLYRDNELIATFVKTDEPFIDTVDAYIEHYEDTEGEVPFTKEDLIKLINYYIKGHSQNLNIKDYTEDEILITVGL